MGAEDETAFVPSRIKVAAALDAFTVIVLLLGSPPVTSKTPPDIIGKMSDGIIASLVDPAIKEELAQLAYAARGSSPDELRKFLKADTEKWSAVIKSAGITIEQ